MATWWNDFKNSVLQGTSIEPQTIASSVNGAFVDMKEAQEGLFALLSIGATSGTNEKLDVTLEEADDGAGLNVQAITDFITGSPAAFAQKSDADAASIDVLNFKRSKRFIRAVATLAGTNPIYKASLSIHGMRRRVL